MTSAPLLKFDVKWHASDGYPRLTLILAPSALEAFRSFRARADLALLEDAVITSVEPVVEVIYEPSVHA